jgi:hypothetical protein
MGWKTNLGILIAVVVAALFILCYFFEWPFPVFCCYFHNWFNHNAIELQPDWICNYTNDTNGGDDYVPPEYTCGDGLYPLCSDGTCPPGEVCIQWNWLTHLGCKCVPEEFSCTDTDGYADIYVYGICSDTSGSYEDYCIDPYSLKEYWCEEGVCLSDYYNCIQPYVCFNGECIDCNEKCSDVGWPWGGYYSGGISCADFEHYIVAYQCCCYPQTG